MEIDPSEIESNILLDHVVYGSKAQVHVRSVHWQRGRIVWCSRDVERIPYIGRGVRENCDGGGGVFWFLSEHVRVRVNLR